MSEPAPDKTTRERILDVALVLFVEKGYDKTSLREIAERMGFTKAALYYHFASKAEILLALHLRLHGILDGALDDLGEGPVSLSAWEGFLNQAIDKIEANRPLFALHQRNQSAFEQVHSKGHEGRHNDLEERIRSLLSDQSMAATVRVRMAAAFSATFVTSMLADTFGDIGDEEFGRAIRDVVHDILQPALERAERQW